MRSLEFNNRQPLERTPIVPSEPVAADELFYGWQIFERVRRPTIGGRRCSPAENSFVAIDRVIRADHLGVLVRRAHECEAGRAIARDLSSRSLIHVGIDLHDTIVESDGHVCVVFSGCPGVRLRALAEKCQTTQTKISDDIVWHLIRRTEQLLQAWSRAGIVPRDTFVAFDGSLHLFPHLAVCAARESPSYLGNEVWDSFVVSAARKSLAQLLCGWLPEPFLQAAQRVAMPFAGSKEFALPIPAAVDLFLGRSRAQTDASQALAGLVRSAFPETYERHARVYAALGSSLELEGRQREQRVLEGNQ